MYAGGPGVMRVVLEGRTYSGASARFPSCTGVVCEEGAGAEVGADRDSSVAVTPGVGAAAFLFLRGLITYTLNKTIANIKTATMQPTFQPDIEDSLSSLWACLPLMQVW